jgi:hypothetical protein
MVAIAREESRNGVMKVGGTDFFKKEAWFADNLAGFEVKGYAPTEFERERCGAATGDGLLQTMRLVIQRPALMLAHIARNATQNVSTGGKRGLY